jgi:DNA replication protein DnaC
LTAWPEFSFEERLGLLVEREVVERASKRLVTRLKFASLRQNATVEDLNTRAARGLDKALFAKLATGDWIARRQDLLITGKTGTGKSWLACALGQKAAVTIDRCSIIACRACSMPWRWHAAMDVMHAFSRASPGRASRSGTPRSPP